MNKPSYPKHDTKLRVILDCLEAAQGRHVGLNKLMRLANSGAVHSDISSLRLIHGWKILNRQVRVTINGKRINHSSYALPIGQADLQGN